jgi:uncharacterized protein (TIGR03067 family)
MPVSTSERPAVGKQVRHDLERLQGVWLSVAGRRRAELLVAGNLFTFRILDGELYMGSFVVDADGEPHGMDMTIYEGPARHKGLVTRCIFQVEGDALRWCASDPGTDHRLAAFPGMDDRRYLSLVFRRERPRGT